MDKNEVPLRLPFPMCMLNINKYNNLITGEKDASINDTYKYNSSGGASNSKNSSEYADITDNDFYNKINKKFKKYKIENVKQSFNEICYPKDFNPQPSQLFLSKFINPDTPYKSVLVFHGIGSGKTCTAVKIGEAWKQYRKIIFIAPAALIGNFRNELRSKCAGNEYISDKDRNELKKLHPKDSRYIEIIEKSNKLIDGKYDIYSYNKLIKVYDEGKLNLNNKVVIIDEIQNLVSERGSNYKKIYEMLHNAPSNIRIVLLSATPMFDKPQEIALTMNLLKLKKELPTGIDFNNEFIDKKVNSKGEITYKVKNLDGFKNYIKGYISYYKGAPAHSFPDGIIKYVKCEMGEFQFKSYMGVLNKSRSDDSTNGSNVLGFRSGDILNMPENFMLGLRMISNIAYPNKGIKAGGYDSLSKKNMIGHELKIYSTKFYSILTKIKSVSAPVFVYSNFREYGGIKSFIKVLKANGYKSYMKYGEGKKRYGVWSGKEDIKVREEMKVVFNNPKNIDGSKLKIMIGSPSIKEGISFFNVKQIHILEPYWNWSRMQQIIGRAIRYCSHKMLPVDERFVKVYIYIAIRPDGKESVDQYISSIAIKKKTLIEEFENAMKESAIDCDLFRYGNLMAGDENIKCDK